MSRYLGRGEFARLAGVSAPAITQACRASLAAACERDRIDVEHPAAVAYLARAKARAGAGQAVPTIAPRLEPPPRVPPTPPAAPPPRGRSAGAPTNPPDPLITAPPEPTRPSKRGGRPPREPTEQDPELALWLPRGTDEELAAYRARLRPLVRRFGGERAFKDWLEALQRMEAILKARLDNGERAGRLISRELVQTHVVGALDGMMRLLLTDSSKTIVRRAYTMARSGKTAEEGEAMAREIMSSQLVHVRDKVRKLLAQARVAAMRGDEINEDAADDVA